MEVTKDAEKTKEVRYVKSKGSNQSTIMMQKEQRCKNSNPLDPSGPSE